MTVVTAVPLVELVLSYTSLFVPSCSQDLRTLDQLQRSSELLQQLQKQQQQQQMWWGGLLFTSSSGWGGTSSKGSGSGNGGGLYPTAAAGASPAGRSPERASSTSLSVISEDEATCVPHPFQPLRIEGWLRRLDEEQEQQQHQQQGVSMAVSSHQSD